MTFDIWNEEWGNHISSVQMPKHKNSIIVAAHLHGLFETRRKWRRV